MNANRNRISRPQMVAVAASTIPYASINDLPLIRQTVNDLADSWRKDGWECRDFAQDAIVQAIRRRVFETAMSTAKVYFGRVNSCRVG